MKVMPGCGDHRRFASPGGNDFRGDWSVDGAPRAAAPGDYVDLLWGEGGRGAGTDPATATRSPDRRRRGASSTGRTGGRARARRDRRGPRRGSCSRRPTMPMLPTAIVGTPASWRMRSANGVWYMRPYCGAASGTVCPAETSMTSQPCAFEHARDLHRLVGRRRRPACQSVAEMRTRDRLLRGPRRAHRVEHLEREAHAVLERAAVLVGAPVRERREEARQQVAVRHVQLEQVEAGPLGAARRRARSRRARGPCRARSIARGDRAVRRDTAAATARAIGQLPSRERRVALPRERASSPCGPRARAGARSSRGVCACTKSTMRRQAATCSSARTCPCSRA